MRSNSRHWQWALLLLLAPVCVQAAGLGPITVSSTLGMPLHAEIDLRFVKGGDVASLRARPLASHRNRQALPPPIPPSDLNVAVAQRANGEPYLLVTTATPIRDPLANVLVEVEWQGHRIARTYALMLSPPPVAPGPLPGRQADRIQDRAPTPAPPRGETAASQPASERVPARAVRDTNFEERAQALEKRASAEKKALADAGGRIAALQEVIDDMRAQLGEADPAAGERTPIALRPPASHAPEAAVPARERGNVLEQAATPALLGKADSASGISDHVTLLGAGAALALFAAALWAGRRRRRASETQEQSDVSTSQNDDLSWEAVTQGFEREASSPANGAGATALRTAMAAETPDPAPAAREQADEAAAAAVTDPEPAIAEMQDAGGEPLPPQGDALLEPDSRAPASPDSPELPPLNDSLGTSESVHAPLAASEVDAAEPDEERPETIASTPSGPSESDALSEMLRAIDFGSAGEEPRKDEALIFEETGTAFSLAANNEDANGASGAEDGMTSHAAPELAAMPDFELGSDEPPAASEPPAAETEPAPTLEWDTPESLQPDRAASDRSADTTDASAPHEAPGDLTNGDAEWAASRPVAKSDEAAGGIDFDVNPIFDAMTRLATGEPDSAAGREGPAHSDFSIEPAEGKPRGEAAPNIGGPRALEPRGADWHDVQEKFELARAFEILGADPDAVIRILEEIIREGDARQRSDAKQWLERLPGPGA